MKLTLLLTKITDRVVSWFWMPAFLSVVLFQHLGLTIVPLSVGSVFQLSDSGNWLACSFSFPTGDDWRNNWCMRRPLTFVLLSPVAASAAWGAGMPILLNALFAIGAAQTLINASRDLKLNLWLLNLASIPLMVTAVYYGLSMGPEALAFALSCVAVVAILKTFSGPQKGFLWPIIGCLAVVSSFLIRPGNPLLTLTVVAILISFLFSTRRYQGVISGSLGVGFLVWGLPATLSLGFGLKEAAHGSNFWAVIYPLVSEQADGWPDVYRIFSEKATGIDRDTVAWGQLVRNASFHEFFENPLYAVKSFGKNLISILDSGWLNLAVPLPETNPQWQIFTIAWWLQQDSILVVIFSFASVALWVASWQSLVIALRWLLMTIPKSLKTRHPATQSTAWNLGPYVPGILGVATLLGLLAFFGLVGHDEATRHLVQSLPFAIFAFNPKLFSESNVAVAAGISARGLLKNSRTLKHFSVALSTVALIAIFNGLQIKPNFVLLGQCDVAESSPRTFSIVGQKSRGVESTKSGSGWVEDAFSELEPGVLVMALEYNQQNLRLFYLQNEKKSPLQKFQEATVVPRLCETPNAPSALEPLYLPGLRSVPQS